MIAIVAHVLRLIFDLILIGILYSLRIYEFPTWITVLIILRIFAGHIGRIIQQIASLDDEFEGLIAGIVAALIRTGLEIAIMIHVTASEYGPLSRLILGSIIVIMIARNVSEAFSLCQDFAD